MSAGGLIGPGDVLECVVNVSEGRDAAVIAAMSSVAGAALLDVHTDADHNRSVLTLAGPAAEVTRAARQVVTEAVARIDIGRHRGVHPRLGAVDVVPWVHLVTGPDGRLRDGGPEVATRARDRFAAWAGAELGLPCFLYGPGSGRSLPDLRRHAWRDYRPDTGPDRPHPTSGATCVGARPVLVAYNLWLAEPDLTRARRVAAEVRQAGIRTLGLQVGPDVQVSCNLIDPWTVGPGAAFDAVASRVEVRRAELVGLLPLAVLDAIPSSRWSLLDVGPAATIEARLGRAGLDGGRFTWVWPPSGGGPPD
jgi:glutamate formiminotransferase